MKTMYCDKASMFFLRSCSSCVEEEGKGRGFLSSLQVTREGRSRRHDYRKKDGGKKRVKKRQRKGKEIRETRAEVNTEGGREKKGTG